MRWIPVDEDLPAGDALICAEGAYYLAVLVSDDGDDAPAFLDIHSSDLLPWPSHWMALPALPPHA